MTKELTAGEFAEYLQTLGVGVPVRFGEYIATLAGAYSLEDFGLEEESDG